MNTEFKFEELQVYQKSLAFLDYVYQITSAFPKEERYQLSSQYVRAAQSICLNIAEGAGGTRPQFNRYLQIAQSSIRECVVCSTIAKRRKYTTGEINQQSRALLLEMAKMTSSLQNYLRTPNPNN